MGKGCIQVAACKLQHAVYQCWCISAKFCVGFTAILCWLILPRHVHPCQRWIYKFLSMLVMTCVLVGERQLPAVLTLCYI